MTGSGVRLNLLGGWMIGLWGRFDFRRGLPGGFRLAVFGGCRWERRGFLLGESWVEVEIGEN